MAFERCRPTRDEQAGIDWWNGLTARERKAWMARAGNTGVVADAWATYRRNAIHARLDLVACERALPPDEVKNAKACDDALIDFACRHDINLDWLILGDLRARLRMARSKTKS